MSQALDLLNSLSDAGITSPYAGGLGSKEEHIVIGRDRYVIVPDSLKKIGVQFDKDIETVTFDCPRYWDNHDMSKMKIYINYVRQDMEPGSFIATNITVDSKDNNLMHFDWTISDNVTAVEGTITFLVCIKSTDSQGNEKNHWNSEINTDMFISQGMETVETVIKKHPDIITQLLQRMEAVEAVQDIAVNAAAEATNKAAEAGGYSNTAAALLEETKVYAKTAQDIAADTVNIHGRIDRNDKRLTILEQGLSDYVPSVTDTAVAYVKDVPTNALPYTRINEIGGMTRKCENLLPFPYYCGGAQTSTTKNGIDYTVNDDGSITLNGTSTGSLKLTFLYSTKPIDMLKAGETYRLSVDKSLPSGAGIHIYYRDDTGAEKWASSVSWKSGYELYQIYLQVNTGGVTFSNHTIYPMLNRGETALPYEPYFEGLRDAKVTAVESVGANLIPFPYYRSVADKNGALLVAGSDGSITVSGTPSEVISLSLLDTYNGIKLCEKWLDSITFALHGTNTNVHMQVDIYDKTNVKLLERSVSVSIPLTCVRANYPTAHKINIFIKRHNDNVEMSGTVYPMCNIGDTALPYTPYFKRTFEIPEAVQNLDGYGWGINDKICNKIVLDPASGVKKLVKMVEKFVFDGTESWEYSASNNGFIHYLDYATKNNIVSTHYESTSVSFADMPDDTIRTSNRTIKVRDDRFATINDFKEWLAGQYSNGTPLTAVCKLATPEEIDLTPYFTDDNLIGVEASGTITAVNEYAYDVPTSLTTWTKKTS